MVKKINYPLTEDSTRKVAGEIFSAISKGESVSTVWVPLAGRRTFNSFLVDNIELFQKELHNHKRHLVVTVEPLDLTEESMLGYIRLVGNCLIDRCEGRKDFDLKCLNKTRDVFNDDLKSYPSLLAELKAFLKYLVEEKYIITIFWAEFDDLSYVSSVFFGNLKSLWNQFYPNLQYVFLIKRDVVKRERVYLWGDLNQLILQNVSYVHLLDKKDSGYVIKRICNGLRITPSADELAMVEKMCGGHPYMLYVGLKELRDSKGSNGFEPELLTKHYALDSCVRAILDVWDDYEISILKKVALGQDLTTNENRHVEVFEKLGIVVQVGSKRILFNKVFREGVLNIVAKHIGYESELSIDPKTSQIMYLGKQIEDKFTQQEYKVLYLLLSNEEIIITRDAIATTLWGVNADEKYSDWAIDQLMSKTRKKLSKLNSSYKLVTVRGKGYKLGSLD